MKQVIFLAAVALFMGSCTTIRIAPGQVVANKDLKGKRVVLTQKPGAKDSIIITIVKAH